MRILVLSDSHGRKSALEKAVRLHEEARCIIFLGDGIGDMENIELLYPEKTIYKVAGNCDFFCSEPEIGKAEIAGRLLYFTHGHLHGVKGDLEKFKADARAAGADIALYGHTHIPVTEYDDRLYVMNPGSIGARGSYGIIDITPAGIVTYTAEL